MELPQIGPAEPKIETNHTPIPVNDDQPFSAQPYAPLIGFLELGESELTNKNQTHLNEIWEYLGKESKSELVTERLQALRNLENRLSPPKINQTRFGRIHAYVQAQKEVERAESWRNGFLK